MSQKSNAQVGQFWAVHPNRVTMDRCPHEKWVPVALIDNNYSHPGRKSYIILLVEQFILVHIQVACGTCACTPTCDLRDSRLADNLKKALHYEQHVLFFPVHKNEYGCLISQTINFTWWALWDPAPCFGDFKVEHKQDSLITKIVRHSCPLYCLGISRNVKIYNVIYLTLLLLSYLNIVCAIIPEIAGDWSWSGNQKSKVWRSCLLQIVEMQEGWKL
jgi:hypothetical protein